MQAFLVTLSFYMFDVILININHNKYFGKRIIYNRLLNHILLMQYNEAGWVHNPTKQKNQFTFERSINGKGFLVI